MELNIEKLTRIFEKLTFVKSDIDEQDTTVTQTTTTSTTSTSSGKTPMKWPSKGQGPARGVANCIDCKREDRIQRGPANKITNEPMQVRRKIGPTGGSDFT